MPDSNMLEKNRIFLALALGVNSFSVLVFETIIIKQLSFLMGSWNYILSIVLCSFMIGTGIGALAVLNKKVVISTRYVVVAQTVSALVTFGMLLRFDAILAKTKHKACIVLRSYF